MYEIFFVIFGLAIFLFGMDRLENGVRGLSNKGLTRWLKRSTNNRVTGAISGIGITALLQSSSMVSLMVLAFVGGGLLPMANGISVILGANLGTTMTGWIVATLGFKLSLTKLAIPLLGFGAALHILSRNQKAHYAGNLLIGLALILMGLDTMKIAMSVLPELVPIEQLKNLPPWAYLLVGVFFASAIQSSSATMMITLTTLNAGYIDLTAAAAITIGADIGTTSTPALAALTGPPAKKQLALAHVIFNLTVGTCAFLFLLPWVPTFFGGFSESLYGLVAFHSVVNGLGLLCFLPFVKPYARFLSRRFNHAPVADTKYVHQVPVKMVDAAIEALEKELFELRLMVFNLNVRNMHLETQKLKLTVDQQNQLTSVQESKQSFDQQYHAIKHLEGLLMQYGFKIQRKDLSNDQLSQVNRRLNQARHIVLAAKALKDIRQDLVDFRTSERPAFKMKYKQLLKPQRKIYRKLVALTLSPPDHKTLMEEIGNLATTNQEIYDAFADAILYSRKESDLGHSELSTLMNAAKAIWLSNDFLFTSFNGVK